MSTASVIDQPTREGAPVRERAPGRIDPFRSLPRNERRRQLDAYLRELERRDGELDFEAQRLPKREARLEALARDRVTWSGEVNRDAFEQAFRRRSRSALDPRTLWLVGISKANESESWGAEGEYRRLRAHGTNRVDRRELYVLIEEQYHRRLLAEACRTCGLGPREPVPPAIIRALIRVMQHLPGQIRYAPILCGEVLGCVVFSELLERCHLFGDQPEVEARLRSLIGEMLDDEALHVVYSRARLGALGVRVARWLLPVVATVFTRAIPQLLELGCRREHLIARVREGLPLPVDADWVEADRIEAGSTGRA